ncbi:gamma carbonic anhydrase family protein [Weeksella virosa]|uniref:gamma carbonic anhydrase family protein n=1 Tax=Weeksella virosa TaxID=1014 RepID=UPI0025533B97|nr:gamma carbonic anhydrase family protein [Weeksella virosa]MDK7375467.1 gamma carbonic anhydrase family protein [Weeksella virosa]
MAYIKELNGKQPRFGENCFLAENAVIVGDVEMGDNCSIWFSAVLRGDVHFIKIGNNVNVQDNATVHATYKKSPTTIGNFVSIGHNAIVHGCTIHDNVLIGMGAIVMDDCIIESNSLIAAGAVLPKGTHVKEGELWAGVPAKKIREVPNSLKEGEIERIANNYTLYSSWYKSS